jgi:hypothetical protein
LRISASCGWIYPALAATTESNTTSMYFFIV